VRRVIFLFLDGVGIGPGDPEVNPLAAGKYPVLADLLQGHPLTAETGRLRVGNALLAPLDAQLGVPGRPQSATGQAALLTGLNAPQLVGEHYGPRPDARVRAVVDRANLFVELGEAGFSTYFCNAYPQGYFDAVARGKRLLSVLPYAASQGGQSLLTADDLYAGRALAADFTAAGWRSQLGYVDAPVRTPHDAGRQLWRLSHAHQFVLFEHWLTDMLGHRRQLAAAVENFRRFDAFLGGLLAAVRADGLLEETLILIASDHGNVEDCSHGKHTENLALALMIGGESEEAEATLTDLTEIAPLILRFLDSG
jgi:2,3-bisphosphoglycerate-independent phosphoglycerate mutase